MKNLLTALFLVFSINTFAQTSFGVKGGLTLGKIVGETPIDYVMAPGYTAGILLNRQLKGHASFQVELNYTKKVYAQEIQFIDEQQNPQGTGKANYSNSYLELPLLIKYSKKEGDVKPYFLLGGTISYLLGSKYNSIGAVIPNSTGPKSHTFTLDYFKKGDAGATFGIGTDIKAGPVIVILEARYNQGFISMYKPSANPNIKEPKVFNSYLSLTTGIRF